MHGRTGAVDELILEAWKAAREETRDEPEPEHPRRARWPIACEVGPGLEGAIACESRVGYVNGAKGWLVYRGYDVFDLCAHSSFEEVCFLLLHGDLPDAEQQGEMRDTLVRHRRLNKTLRLLLGFPVEEMNAMAALRLGTNLMRQELTLLDTEEGRPPAATAIGSDEDSIAMETPPRGGSHATFEIRRRRAGSARGRSAGAGLDACYHLISGVSTLVAAIARARRGLLPIEPDPELGHAANLLYMTTGRRPTPLEERVMDVALILHADHGMNASTFAALVVASTLSDIYFSVGSGIAALNGPLHGGANEGAVRAFEEIGEPARAAEWVERTLAKRGKISGFGHRVYRAYDPRARVLRPLARLLAEQTPSVRPLLAVAEAVEREATTRLGADKKVFPNVDFYSGIVYRALGIDPAMFTPLFAASRVAGWTARVLEYLQNNRIFRPRARYIGELGKSYVPMELRAAGRRE